MRQTPDINPNIRKAQQDVDRFEASKKGLVPEFELPKDEEREKRYSEETLIADFITERIESKEAKELINNPILIKTAYQDFFSDAKRGKEGDTTSAALALWTSSALTTVRNYLREKGKKIDDTNAANEALKFKKTIPPRPETRAF